MEAGQEYCMGLGIFRSRAIDGFTRRSQTNVPYSQERGLPRLDGNGLTGQRVGNDSFFFFFRLTNIHPIPNFAR